MRTTSLNGMLTSLATNYNRRNKNVRLYELGNIYVAKVAKGSMDGISRTAT